jgi:hypothetical protein
MPPARKRAGDLTGLETQRLQAENMAELKKRQTEIALMAEVEEEMNEIPIDYSAGPTPIVVKDEVEEEEIFLDTPTRVIVPNTTLEQMTFGAGNHYTFEEGRRYTVPVALARHLSSKGLLWEGGYR